MRFQIQLTCKQAHGWGSRCGSPPGRGRLVWGESVQRKPLTRTGPPSEARLQNARGHGTLRASPRPPHLPIETREPQRSRYLRERLPMFDQEKTNIQRVLRPQIAGKAGVPGV